VAGDFEEIGEASVADVMAESAEDHCEDAEGSEELLHFGGVRQQVAGVHY
jgi:hypothetical protein